MSEHIAKHVRSSRKSVGFVAVEKIMDKISIRRSKAGFEKIPNMACPYGKL